jgi:hypothetical protein
MPTSVDWVEITKWLDHWQTLVGAAIAIPIASLAIVVPHFQERTRLKRHFIAVRATMPLRLSAISQYAQDAGRALAACRTPTGVDRTATTAFVKPSIPNGLIEGLEKTIEATGDRWVVRRLARTIREIQVLDSRLSAVATEDHDGPYFDSMLMGAGTIYAQASSLYEFARDLTWSTCRVLPWANIVSGLHIMGVREGDFTPLFAMIARFEARHRDPERFATDGAVTSMVGKLTGRFTALAFWRRG